MAISEAAYKKWLLDGSLACCILVEVDVNVNGQEITRYLSTRPYFDDAAKRLYEPIIIAGSVVIDEQISLDGTSALNFGDIAIDNKDHRRDRWLNDIWTRRAFTVHVGDVRWARSDFRQKFTGITADIDSRGRDELNLKARDKLERINMPVTEELLGGSTANKNELVPLCFGEVHNISPLLTNPATLNEKVHNGSIEGFIEMRSNGSPAELSADTSNGEFTPDVNPQGTKVTVSVQGDKPGGVWLKTVKQIIERLVTGFGEANNRFNASDLDADNLNAFDAANQQPIGVYLDRRENLRRLCDDIAGSVGAQLVSDPVTGKLQLHKIQIPPPGVPVAFDIIEGTLRIDERLAVVAAHKIAYAKNWTVQTSLDTGLPQEHKDLFEKEWLTVTVEDAAIRAKYRQDVEPPQSNTYLLAEADASAEANRRLDLTKTQRTVFSFQASPRAIEAKLGDAGTIRDTHFGLENGKTGMVVRLRKNYETLIVNVGVLV